MSGTLRALFALLAALALCGCAAVEREHTPHGGDQPAAGKALVYFFRPFDRFGALRVIRISDGDQALGDLVNGSYFVYQAAPGSHLFVGNGHDEDADPVILEAGKRYHFRCTIDPGVWRPHYEVVQMPRRGALPSHLKRVGRLGR